MLNIIKKINYKNVCYFFNKNSKIKFVNFKFIFVKNFNSKLTLSASFSKGDTFDQDVRKINGPFYNKFKILDKKVYAEHKANRRKNYRSDVDKLFNNYFKNTAAYEIKRTRLAVDALLDYGARLDYYQVPFDWFKLSDKEKKKIEGLNLFIEKTYYGWDEDFQSPSPFFIPPDYDNRESYVNSFPGQKFDLDKYKFFSGAPSLDNEREKKGSPQAQLPPTERFYTESENGEDFPAFFSLAVRDFKMSDGVKLNTLGHYRVRKAILEDEATYERIREDYERGEYEQFRIAQNVDYDPDFNPVQWAKTAIERGKMRGSALSKGGEKFFFYYRAHNRRRSDDWKNPRFDTSEYYRSMEYMENNIREAFEKILTKRKYERKWLQMTTARRAGGLGFKEDYKGNVKYDFDLLPTEFKQYKNILYTKKRPRGLLTDDPALRRFPEHQPIPGKFRNRGAEITDRRYSGLNFRKQIDVGDMNGKKNMYFFYYRDGFDRFARLDGKPANTIPYRGSNIYNKKEKTPLRAFNFLIGDYELRLGLEQLIPTGSGALSESGIILYISLIMFFIEVIRHEIFGRLLEHFPKFAAAQHRGTLKGQKIGQINGILAAILPILMVLIHDFGYGGNYTSYIAAYSGEPAPFDLFEHGGGNPDGDKPELQYSLDEIKYANTMDLKKYGVMEEELAPHSISSFYGEKLGNEIHRPVFNGVFGSFIDATEVYTNAENMLTNETRQEQLGREEAHKMYFYDRRDLRFRYAYSLLQDGADLRIFDTLGGYFSEFRKIDPDALAKRYEHLHLDENDLNYFELEHMGMKQFMTPLVSLYGKALAQCLMEYPGAPMRIYSTPFGYRQTKPLFYLNQHKLHCRAYPLSKDLRYHFEDHPGEWGMSEYVDDGTFIYETCVDTIPFQAIVLQNLFDILYDVEEKPGINEFDSKPTYNEVFNRIGNRPFSWGINHYEFDFERLHDAEGINLLFDDDYYDWESEEAALEAYAYGVTSLNMKDIIMKDGLYYYDFENYAHARRKLGNTYLGVDK